MLFEMYHHLLILWLKEIHLWGQVYPGLPLEPATVHVISTSGIAQKSWLRGGNGGEGSIFRTGQSELVAKTQRGWLPKTILKISMYILGGHPDLVINDGMGGIQI